MPGITYGSTYLADMLDIYASSLYAPPISYTITKGGATPNTYGDLILYEGTVLIADTGQDGGPALSEHFTTGTVAAVLAARVNLRLGDEVAPVLMRLAYLNESKCRDNGVFGTVTAGAKTALAAEGITFRNKPG